MPRKYPTSASCHSRYGHSRGRASTASGTSQMTYCGDQTLLVIKNAASTRKHSCGRRGRRGAASASQAIAAQATAKNTADIRLRALSEELPSAGTLKCSKKYQIEPQSAPRSLLNTKNHAQPDGATIITGRSTASQASTAAANIFAKARSCPARRQSSSSGPKTTSG